jgi:cell division transport system permease protein
MLGLLGILLYHANSVSNYVKENIGFTIIVNENVEEARIRDIQKELSVAPYVKESRYITKEEAATMLMKELGEDFVGFLGYNPLLPSLEVRLKATYANNDSITWIEKKILSNKDIKEVYYQKSLVNVINENVRRISLIILAFSTILLLISIVLINNTIRLAVYSKRFIIKTMQLVGATENFIRRPFLLASLAHGIYSALIALLLLTGTLFLAYRQFPDFINMQDYRLYLTLFLLVTILGMVISLISTFFAVRKFLRTRSEFLY